MADLDPTQRRRRQRVLAVVMPRLDRFDVGLRELAALTGWNRERCAQARALSFAASDAVADLIDRIVEFERDLPRTLTEENLPPAPDLRGSVNWQATFATASQGSFGREQYVCVSRRRSTDSPIARLLVSLLRDVRRAGSAAQRYGFEELVPAHAAAALQMRSRAARQLLRSRFLLEVPPGDDEYTLRQVRQSADRHAAFLLDVHWERRQQVSVESASWLISDDAFLDVIELARTLVAADRLGLRLHRLHPAGSGLGSGPLRWTTAHLHGALGASAGTWWDQTLLVQRRPGENDAAMERRARQWAGARPFALIHQPRDIDAVLLASPKEPAAVAV